MAGCDLAVAQGRRSGERNDRLGDPPGGVVLDLGGRTGELGLGGLPADQHPVAPGLVGRLDHQAGEVVEHEGPGRLVAAPVGRHGGQERILTEIEPDDLGYIGVDLLVVGHAGPRRVDQGDPSRAPGAHQPGDPEVGLREEDFGIEVEVVDAPVDHVHPLEALDRARVDAVVVEHDQVAALHELDPELLGEERVLEVGRVVDPGVSTTMVGSPVPGETDESRLASLPT